MNADPRGEAVMAADGYYNRHSSLQAAAAESGYDWLAEAASQLRLPDEGPITIADYGVAQGANSMRPMNVAIEILRARSPAPIEVVHTDLPGNDFAPLFEIFAKDPSSYLRGHTEVFPYAIGRSFYQRLFAHGTVQLGWSSVTTHWLSHSPVDTVGHLQPELNPASVRAQFATVAADDWVAFLEARAAELASGGRLIMVEPASHPQGESGVYRFQETMDDCLTRLVENGTITADQRRRMVLPFWMRTWDEYAEPIDDVRHLRLARGQLFRKPTNPLKAQFDADGDAAAYADGMAGMTRGWSESMLFGSLPNGDAAADDYYRLLAEMGTEDPSRLDLDVWHIMLDIERI